MNDEVLQKKIHAYLDRNIFAYDIKFFVLYKMFEKQQQQQ